MHRTIRIDHDAQSNRAYIHLSTLPVSSSAAIESRGVILQFSHDGILVGIHCSNASAVLDPALLDGELPVTSGAPVTVNAYVGDRGDER